MNQKLSKEAYGGVVGKDYVPYVKNAGLGGNITVIIFAVLLSALFAASTAYSGMKAGLTVAAGLPGTILGSVFITIFAKQKGILGKTLLQGAASGGESIASGMIFVFPAILLIGSQVSFLEGFVIGIGGALFGIGVASLVYNNLIVEEHGKLMYPESMAISETLVASEGAKDSLKFMGIGFGISGFITVLTSSFLNVSNSVLSFVNETFYKWKFELEVNPLLLGIGFIVGMEVTVTMFASSIFANFAITPLIGYFASFGSDSTFVWNNPSVSINTMEIGNIAGSYVKYIGAGMMLSGGLIGAIKLIPTIVGSLAETMSARGKGNGGAAGSAQLLILVAGIVIGFIGGFLISGGNITMALLGAVLSMVLSVMFVIVAGRLTGTIGTSNLPVSGMTIASIVIITLMFVGFGWTSVADNKALLLFGSFLVTAIAAAGGYCQSQKVSFVIGGNKNEMQRYYALASLVGVIVVTSVILLLSNQLSMTGDNVPFALPQANLMATLTAGIMSGQLPWVMVICGAVMGIVLFMLRLPVMTVAIGFYLPISTTSILLVGALIRFFVERYSKTEEEKETKIANGVSLSSGLVAGGSIIGLVGIVLQVMGVITSTGPTGFASSNGMAFILLAILVVASAIPIWKSRVKNVK
ncbi:MAG: OPT/YSL family transporter [Lachnospiraceae bacterium]